MCSSSNNPQTTAQFQQHWRPWDSSTGESCNFPPKPNSSESVKMKCNVTSCNATFKRESELWRHVMSRHKTKRVHCKICRKVFSRKDILTRHVKLAHTGDEKPYCKYCDKILSRRDAVPRHESTCQKNPERKEMPERKTDRQITRYNPEGARFPSHLERLKIKYSKSQLSTHQYPSTKSEAEANVGITSDSIELLK